jgi:predicted acetyltransferase
VAEPDKPVLARLLELYRYDMSTFRPYVLSAHGTFGYRYLDAYFLGDDREAHFIRVDDELAGFTMTRELSHGARTIAEFFVLQRYRRSGVGRVVAHELFARHPGRWIVDYDDANPAGSAFWPQVCEAVAIASVETLRKSDEAVYPGTELRFTT